MTGGGNPARKTGHRRRLGGMLMALAACGVTAVAAANEYDDFRIPAHDQINWSASLGSRALWNTGTSSSTFQYSDSRRSTLDASLGSRLSWLSDSDPALTSVFVGVDFTGQKSWESRQALLDYAPFEMLRFEDSFERRNVMERWQVALSHRHYPWAVPLGLTSSVSGSGNYTQNWRRDGSWMSSEQLGGTRTVVTRATDASWSYVHSVVVDVGLGIGRVRDATGVFEAEVLEQRLLETGALTRPLSPAARRRLAELIYLRGSLGGVRERPARSLWQSVERIVRDDGALSERGLDGYSVMRAGERLYAGFGTGSDGLPSSPVLRTRGWFIGPILSSRNTHSLSHGSSHRFREDVPYDSLNPGGEITVGFRNDNHFDQVLYGGLAEGHWPLSSRWQIDAASQALFPARQQEGGFSTVSQGSATFLIADRWLARAGLGHSRRLRKSTLDGVERTIEDTWNWVYGGQVDYYVEDRLGLNLGIFGDYNHGRSGPATGTSSNLVINLGLSYRLIGRYHATGLLDPVNVTADR